MIKLSVIIPNYNKDKYLDTLLNHLKKQMTNEIEVIVVDDASSDNSPSIIKNYENIFRTYYNKENKYNSYARNAGLLHAEGQYVTFIDSDDDITPDFISMILKSIESGHDGYFFDYNVINVRDSAQVEKGYNTMVWSKVYKKKVLDDNNILFDVKKFPKGVLGEDLDFNLSFIKATNDIIKIDYPIINYNWGVTNSVSNSEQIAAAEPLYEIDNNFMDKWF